MKLYVLFLSGTLQKNDRRGPYLLYYKIYYAVQYILLKGPQVPDHYFRKYFLKVTYDHFEWIVNPFDVAKIDLSGREGEELAELSSDQTLMISFNQKALASFWLSVLDKYSLLSQKAT